MVVHVPTGYLQSSKQSATLDSSYHYNQPRVPAVPARKCAYGTVPFVDVKYYVYVYTSENTPHTLPRSFK